MRSAGASLPKQYRALLKNPPRSQRTTAVIAVLACVSRFSHFLVVSRRKVMDRDRVIKKLVRAAKNAMKQPEFCAPSTDGIAWPRGAAWAGLYDAVRAAEKATPVRRK